MLKKTEINNALHILAKQYPNPKPELTVTTPFELLIATILSAQTTDRQVNICTGELFKAYNTPKSIAALSEAELTEYIKSVGLYKTKGRNIIAACNILIEKHNGEVPKTREELMELPGVGRKTANVVLSNAFNIPAIAVDTHVFRVANRIGIAAADNVEKTEQQLMENIPEHDWGDAHHWLILHGRRVCAARKPACATCPLYGICEHSKAEKRQKTTKANKSKLKNKIIADA